MDEREIVQFDEDILEDIEELGDEDISADDMLFARCPPSTRCR